MAIRESNDYTGLYPREKSSKPLCFIQDYVSENQSSSLSWLEDKHKLFTSRILYNPKPPNVRKKEMSRIKNNLDLLMYNSQYKSVIYGVVGKSAFVGTYCKL